MSQTMIIMLAALGAELLLLLMVLLGASWFSNHGARRRDAKAAAALVARVKQAKPERAEAIEKFLVSGMSMQGDLLEQTKTAMLRSELTLLQRFAGIYKKHDAAAASRFDGDVAAALEPYHALTAQATATAAEGQGPESDEDVEALRKENKRLSDELRITMETMSRMLNEYSTMFAGAETGNTAPISSVATGASATATAEETAEKSPTGGEDTPETEDLESAAAEEFADEVTPATGEASPNQADSAVSETPVAQVDDEMEVAAPGDDDSVMLDTGDESTSDAVADELATPAGDNEASGPADDVESVSAPEVEVIASQDAELAPLPDEGEVDIVALNEPTDDKKVPPDLDSDLFDMPGDDIVDQAEAEDADDVVEPDAETQPPEPGDELFDASQEEGPKQNNAG